ncbi:hypothetical protein [Nonomuraea sp. NPDC049309]|uniref:hypothetical protein n=1 Tax=Nonomuraea sp. NPDC049309 TaxID=3364350 RepID=UPI00371B111E
MDPLFTIAAVAAITFITVRILRHLPRQRGPNQPKKNLLEIASWICGIASVIFTALSNLVGHSHFILRATERDPDRERSGAHAADAAQPRCARLDEPSPGHSRVCRGASGDPFTIRTAHHDGSSCNPHIAIDFDGSPSGDSPITTRVIDEDELTTAQREAADRYYVTCRTAELRAAQTASIGLLRNGKNATPEQCAAAASSASIGNLGINKDAKPADIGFIEGSAICAVTPNNRLARATITKSPTTPASSMTSRPWSSHCPLGIPANPSKRHDKPNGYATACSRLTWTRTSRPSDARAVGRRFAVKLVMAPDRLRDRSSSALAAW